jgi:hypothetical protein
MGEIVRHDIHKNQPLHVPQDRAREQPLIQLRCRDTKEEEIFIETTKQKPTETTWGRSSFPPPQTGHSTEIFSKIANRQSTI